VGSGHVQLKADAAGGLHVAWIEGRDQHSGEGDPEAVGYVHSQDGGATWSQPMRFWEPAEDNAQVALGLGEDGDVLLVWRSGSRSRSEERRSVPQLHYAWSTDSGESWAEPQPVPGFYARSWATPWDAYDMATDALGRIHLVAVGGREEPGRATPVALYHLVWDGERWSSPELIVQYSQPESPEYIRVAMGQGRHLHAVWFVRPEGAFSTENLQVWYSGRELDMPEVTPVPTWTPTPAPPPTLPPSSPTSPPPTPTLVPISSSAPPIEELYTESDELARLGVALLPVAMISVAVGMARWRRRRSG
jgi:hypothetical protein